MKKITYIAIKEDDTDFRIINSKLFKAELNALKKGRYRVIVETLRKNKSNSQLGYYYAGVLPLALELLNAAGWEFVNVDEVDIFFKSLYANKELLNKHTGEIMTVPALKRDMTTTEFSTFVEEVRSHCSEFLGGYIPGPEENMKIEFE